eukprot:COSAG01_NODE_5710_length_4077_cov_2.647428_4_plen_89_part_00
MVPHPPLIAALIAGEEFASKWSFLPFVERSLLNFCRIDIINVGGFTEAMKVSSSAHHYFSAWLSELRCHALRCTTLIKSQHMVKVVLT